MDFHWKIIKLTHDDVWIRTNIVLRIYEQFDWLCAKVPNLAHRVDTLELLMYEDFGENVCDFDWKNSKICEMMCAQ